MKAEKSPGLLTPREVKSFFNHAKVVDYYAEAAVNVGLWRSEELILQRIFSPQQSLLELGCGAGRIAIGLYELGYKQVFATDCCRSMVARGRALAAVLEYDIAFGVQDATRLDFGDRSFDGAIFGFNGLMQIPGRARRQRAMQEVARVLRPGAYFVFTGHDRNHSAHPDYWREETARWQNGTQDPRLEIFGDRLGETPWGELYIHVGLPEEVEADLNAAGFTLEVSVMRSEICAEDDAVCKFADDTRFYIARKLSPASGFFQSTAKREKSVSAE